MFLFTKIFSSSRLSQFIDPTFQVAILSFLVVTPGLMQPDPDRWSVPESLQEFLTVSGRVVLILLRVFSIEAFVWFSFSLSENE